MPLRSRLPLPSTKAPSPEGRWEEMCRYRRKLQNELNEYRAKITAKTATRAEFLAYARADHEERDDAVMQKLFDQESAVIAGATAFTSTPPAVVPQTAPTRLGKWKQAMIYLERLRLLHNVEGAKLRAGTITQAAWHDWKRNVFYPRQRAVHALIQAHREAIEATV